MPCRAGSRPYGSDIDLIEIALLLLVILAVLLAGGVWIAIALMACGYAGMLFVGGSVPPGSRMSIGVTMPLTV